MMRTLRPSSRLVVLCIALLALVAAAGSVTAARGGIDRTAPRVTLTKPAAGATTADTTPRLSGRAGRAPGDRRTVTVRVFAGRRAAGRAQRLFTARRSHRGAWAIDVRPALLPGIYTARARQADARGNRGVSASRTFEIKRPAKPVRPQVTDPTPPATKPPVVVPPVVPAHTAAISSPAPGTETADTTP